MKTCMIEDCSTKLLAKGLCAKHYQRNLRHGHPLGIKPRINFEDRFWQKVNKSEGCWEWTASLGSSGYGQVRVGGVDGMVAPAHRVAYELTHGTVPRGMDMDHTCHNRSCVNPAHLRAVSHKENMENLRGAHRDSKSGVRGVYATKHGSYKVYVCHFGRDFYGGAHKSLEAATVAAEALRASLYTPITKGA